MQFVVVVAVVMVVIVADVVDVVDVVRWPEGANELAPPPMYQYVSCQLAKLVWLHFYYKANRNNNKKRHLGSTGKSVRVSLPLQNGDQRIGDRGWGIEGSGTWNGAGTATGTGTVIHGLVFRLFSRVLELLVRRLFYGHFMDMPAHIYINPCSFGLLPAPPPNGSPLQSAVITSIIYTGRNTYL